MPSLGADMTEGTVTEWLVQAGDAVKKGDIVAVVHTDKADIEIEVFESGTLTELLVPVGMTVPVGTPLAMLRSEATHDVQSLVAHMSASAPLASAAPANEIPTVDTLVSAPQIAEPSDRLRVSPRARKLAFERGIDVHAAAALSVSEIITSSEIAQISGPTATDMTSVDDPFARSGPQFNSRRALAALMARSKREIPHYYVEHRIELGGLLSWLEHENSRRPVEQRVLMIAPVVAAVAVALSENPSCNGTYRDGEFQTSSNVHVALAVSTRDRGLVAPTIRDVRSLTVDELMTRISDVTRRVRSGRLHQSELGDATFTVTSLGDQGVDRVIPVIYPPQVAILGMGRIRREACVDAEDTIVVRPVMQFSLAGDHRVSDGMDGARLLRRIQDILLRPAEITPHMKETP